MAHLNPVGRAGTRLLRNHFIPGPAWAQVAWRAPVASSIPAVTKIFAFFIVRSFMDHIQRIKDWAVELIKDYIMNHRTA